MSNLVFDWVTRISSSGNDAIYKVCADSNNNVYAVGNYGSSSVGYIYDYRGQTAATIPVSNGIDAFLVKYDSSGNYKWYYRLSSSGTENGYAICCDGSDNICIAGSCANTLTIYNSSGATAGTLPNTTPTSTEAFLSKFSSEGAYLWSTKTGGNGSGSESFRAICSDEYNNIYVEKGYTDFIKLISIDILNYYNYLSVNGSYFI